MQDRSKRRRLARSGSTPPLRPAFLPAALALAVVAGAACAPASAAAEDARAQAPLEVVAKDRPGDAGGRIVVTWREAPGDTASTYRIERSSDSAGPFEPVGEAPARSIRFEDADAPSGKPFFYRVVAVLPAGEAVSETTSAARSRANWFRNDRTNALILVLAFTGLIVGFIEAARRGTKLFIRRISGLSAIDEAIGRATEMGRKILYVPGIQSMDEIQTIASLAILGYVAKVSATYGADLDVPNRDPLTYASARETVKHAYMEAGRPDLYREETVNYITYDQFAYTAAVTGRMVREKPAANFFIGSFYAESLILSEMGQTTGAIQIAGTAEVFQLPFFVATCDYTLIGEELYAASAYLSREPVLLGSIKGQDIAKALLLVLGAVGVVLTTFGNPIVANWLTMR